MWIVNHVGDGDGDGDGVDDELGGDVEQPEDGDDEGVGDGDGVGVGDGDGDCDEYDEYDDHYDADVDYDDDKDDGGQVFNPYQKVISIIGKTLLPFTEPGQVGKPTFLWGKWGAAKFWKFLLAWNLVFNMVNKSNISYICFHDIIH